MFLHWSFWTDIILRDHSFPPAFNFWLLAEIIINLNRNSSACFLDSLGIILSAYVFISEYEEVCIMMKIQQLSDNIIRLKFIPFALNDNAKKQLYSISTNSISKDKFVKAFLKKFLSIHKTAPIINVIINSSKKRTLVIVQKRMCLFHLFYFIFIKKLIIIFLSN